MAEVESPVTRKGSKVGFNQPMSPGAKSNPSLGSGQKTDSIPPQPSNAGGGGVRSHAEDPLPSSTPVVVGPD